MIPFCAPIILGVMGWSCQVFWRAATLYDVTMAVMGFGAWHGLSQQNKYPDYQFLTTMMTKYPD